MIRAGRTLGISRERSGAGRKSFVASMPSARNADCTLALTLTLTPAGGGGWRLFRQRGARKSANLLAPPSVRPVLSTHICSQPRMPHA